MARGGACFATNLVRVFLVSDGSSKRVCKGQSMQEQQMAPEC